MSIARITGLALLAVALLLFCVGTSTYYWPSTTGTIINVKSIHTVIDQTPTGVPELKHSRPKNTIAKRTTTTYAYSVDNQKYTNDVISILNKYKLSTEGTQRLKKGDPIHIKYLPFYKSYSVMEPGLPVTTIIFFSLAGYILLKLRKIQSWIISVLLKLK